MCLIAVAWRVSARFPLIVVANRDEEHARAAAPAAEWSDDSDIVGGRDLRAGGSWLALSRRGRLAAVTNVRESAQRELGLLASDGGQPRSDAVELRSRGHLVRDFLKQSENAASVAQSLAGHAAAFGPFNLLLWDGLELVAASNRPGARWSLLDDGVHALSNGNLDQRWPKAERLSDAVSRWLAAQTGDAAAAPEVETLFNALADEQPAEDAQLPDTGLGAPLERRLSPVFLRGDVYGTRSSTVVLVRRDGRATLTERNFGPGGLPIGERRCQLTLEMPLR